MDATIHYEHRQTGWPIVVTGLVPLAVGCALGAALPGSQRAIAPAALVGLALVSAVVLLGFTSLSVVVTSTQLVARFGIGLVRRTIALDDIASIDVARTRWIDGWGIRRTRRGMLYNVAGFDAVEIRRRDGSCLRVGSDEPERLVAVVRRTLDARRTVPDDAGLRS